MKIILYKILPIDIVDIIYNIIINDYIKYKLYGRMFNLENILNAFIKNYNNENKESIYFNDYIMLNNILNTSYSIFKHYNIIKNYIINNDFNDYFNYIIKLIIKSYEIMNIHINSEKQCSTIPHIHKYGEITLVKFNKLIKLF